MCHGCGRQFDVTGRPAGDRFRCFCGDVVVATAPEPRDAEVLRCPSCGAGAIAGKPDCAFCGTAFSLFERDRTTVCPACLTRCSAHGRFCHHCARPLIGEADVGSATALPCPECPERQLTTRRVQDMTLLECGGCAGLWVEHDAIALVTERARAVGRPFDQVAFEHAMKPFREGRRLREVVYRRCPTCLTHMARRNWGKASGVVIDQCPRHGTWFDHGELEQILTWIRAGGEAYSQKVARAEQSANDRIKTVSTVGAVPSYEPVPDVSIAAEGLLHLIATGFRLLK